MLQVKIFEANTYEDLEYKINTWLSDKDEPKAITSLQFFNYQIEGKIDVPGYDNAYELTKTNKFVAVYHFMPAHEAMMIQAQQGGPKLYCPQ